MAGERPETIVEEREEVMIPITADANPIQRTAYFIKPTLEFIKQQSLFRPPPLSSPFTDFKLEEWPLKLVFTGWIDPPKKWKIWVEQMHSSYQSIWKKSGIYEAIMGSTYRTRRNYDLFLSLAERWCPFTNSFIFPWGEATITMEDIMVLGGFCVTGEPVFKPLETTELVNIEEQLEKSLELETKVSRHQGWMKQFMGEGSEFEHIAFLSLWLSRYVFGQKLQNTISGDLFSVAIHLAHGTRLALGPAVLASIYRDMSLLKGTIMHSLELLMNGRDDEFFSLTLQAPLRLVQVWAWERFPGLRPVPNAMNYGEPRIARWHGSKMLVIEDVRMVLDSAQDTFQWRPYATPTGNWPFPKFYPEKEEWMVIYPHSDQELQSFAQCLRVCELVGIDCLELYLPHRVAMQFGIDQDLPCTVTRFLKNPETAWSNYSKLIWNAKLYVPARLFEADVTTRYLAWWKQFAGKPQADFTGIVRRPRSSRRCRRSPWGSTIKKEVAADDDAEVPPGFPPKHKMTNPKTSESYLSSSIGKKEGNDAEVPPGFPPKHKMTNPKTSESYLSSSIGKKEGNDADVPPGFEPKYKMTNPKTSESYLSSSIGKKEGNDADVPPGFEPKHKMINPKTSESYLSSSIGKKEGNDAEVPPGFPPKHKMTNPKTSESYLSSSIGKKEGNDAAVPPGFEPKHKMTNPKTSESYLSSSIGKKEGNDADVPPGFEPKHKMINPKTSESYLSSSIGKKEGNDAEVPPGFPPKHKMTNPKTSESYLSSSIGKKEGNDAAVPPGFEPKHKMTNPKTSESYLSSSIGKKEGNDADVPPGFEPKHKMTNTKTSESYLSSSIGKKEGNDADVPPGFEPKSKLIHCLEKIMQNEGVPGDAGNANGSGKYTSCSDVYSTPEMNENEAQQRSYRAVEIPGLELELRISRLERVIADMKAERLAAYSTSIRKL